MKMELDATISKCSVIYTEWMKWIEDIKQPKISKKVIHIWMNDII